MEVLTTLIFSQTPVNKVFPPPENKSPNVVFAGEGRSRIIDLKVLVEIFNIDPSVKSSVRHICIVPGINVNYTRYAITTLENSHLVGTMRNAIATPYDGIPELPYQTKTNDSFSYNWQDYYGLLVLDCDQKERDVKDRVTPEFLKQYVLDAIPELSSVQMIEKLSSSNCYPIGENPPVKGNFHLFIAVPFPYIVKIGEYLRKKLVIDGYGFLRVGEKGALTVKSLIDKAAYDKPSGIIFTTRPSYDSTKYEYNHSCKLIENTSEMCCSELCAALDKYDHTKLDIDFKEHERAIQNSDPDKIALSKKRKAVAKEDRIQKKMDDGLTREQATEFASKIDNKILPRSHKVEFAGHGKITLERAIELNLHDVYCEDPVESDIPEYAGVGRAKLINDAATDYDKGRGWYIYSFLHEVKNIYQVEAPNKQEVLYALTGKLKAPVVDPIPFEIICYQRLTTYEGIIDNTLALRYKYEKDGTLDGLTVTRKFNKRRRQFASYRNSRLVNKIASNIFWHFWSELKKQAKDAGKNLPREDLKKGYKKNVERILNKVLVERDFVMKTTKHALRLKSLKNKGISVSADSGYNEYRTWSDKLPLIIKSMEEMGYIETTPMQKNGIHIQASGKLLTIDTCFQMIGRDVWIDDNPVYFEKSDSDPIHYVERKLFPPHLADQGRVLINSNRQTAKMNFAGYFPDVRLVYDVFPGGVEIDEKSWRFIQLESEPRKVYHHKLEDRLTKLKPLVCKDLEECLAILDAIYEKSVFFVRKAFMEQKKKYVPIEYRLCSFQTNGIPHVITGNSVGGIIIYTTEAGFKVADDVRVQLEDGTFKYSFEEGDGVSVVDGNVFTKMDRKKKKQELLEKMEKLKAELAAMDNIKSKKDNVILNKTSQTLYS